MAHRIIIFLVCMYIYFLGRGVRLFLLNPINIFHVMVYIFKSCTFLIIIFFRGEGLNDFM